MSDGTETVVTEIVCTAEMTFSGFFTPLLSTVRLKTVLRERQCHIMKISTMVCFGISVLPTALKLGAGGIGGQVKLKDM